MIIKEHRSCRVPGTVPDQSVVIRSRGAGALPGESTIRQRHGQRGQALAETIVVISFVIVPFFVAVPLLAKYQDMRQATVSASRTAAFECSVRFEACRNGQATDDIVDQIRRRHFSKTLLGLRSDETPADDQLEQERNRFWVDRKGNALLQSYRDVALRIDHENFDAIKGKPRFEEVLDAMSNVAGPGRFGLMARGGLFSAQVQSRAPMDQWLWGKLNLNHDPMLTFDSRLGILADAWNASSAKGTEASSLTSRLDKGRRLPSARDLIKATNDATHVLPPDVVNGLPSGDPERFIEAVHRPLVKLIHFQGEAVGGNGERFDYHNVNVEIIPQDRLQQQRAETRR